MMVRAFLAILELVAIGAPSNYRRTELVLKSYMKFIRSLWQLPIITWIVLLAGSASSRAQGQIDFQTFAGGNVDARVTFLDGTPVSAGYTAQLFGGPAGTVIDRLTPLFPTTRFETSRERWRGYVFDVEVTVPDINPSLQATILMRAFNGPTWEFSSCRGESNPITIRLGGGGGQPPATLIGLQPFQVNCVPEPSSVLLFGFGIAGLLLGGRRLRLRRR
jgi:hypothetical protein